jgi:cell division protein FtsW (lipid II flippase)
MVLDYLALVLLILVVLVMFYGIIVIHDIPYEISVKRNHPHQDAIHVAGWISLFTLHTIWPFLWIWATLYREDRGWGMSSAAGATADNDTSLSERLTALEARLSQLENGEG